MDDGRTKLELVRTEILPPEDSEKGRALARILEVENQLFLESTEIVSDIHAFRDLSPEEIAVGQPPASWTREFGARRALQRYRVASAAWLPMKDAPIALKIVTQMAAGIMKVKAMERSAGKGGGVFNAVVVNVHGEPMPEYPKQEVER